MVRGLGYMKKLFGKKQWKDIFILVILIGITFLRYNSFKKLEWFLISFIIIAGFTTIYALVYSLYNCKSNKERKWLSLIYLSSIIFMHPGDCFDVFIYFLVAAIFLENRDNFLKSYFIISTLIIVITIASYFLEIIPAFDIYWGEIRRMSLGFANPNSIFRFFFGSLMALYLIDKNKAIFNIYSIAGTVVLYIFTNSRTGLICGMLFIILANLAIIFDKLVDKIHFKWCYLLFALFSVFYIVCFNNHSVLNDTLSGRPTFLYDILSRADWHLLYGNMTDFKYCDNRIIYLMVRNGCFALVSVIIFYYFTFRKKTSVELKVLFVMSMIYGLTENYRALGQTIVPLLCMWSIYDNYIKNKMDVKNDKNIQKIANSDKN